MGIGDGYDVFVSYPHSDGAAAAELNGWLAAQNLRTFFDRRELRAGLRWLPALEDAIGRSKAVAILVGRYGIGNTQQYERELALVRRTGDPKFPVIPVLMPGCESPPTGFLQLLTWVDFRNGPGVLQQPDRLAALGAALRGETADASSLRASICPFRGLEPFREEDEAFFCGRDNAIRELVARVQAHSFVAVVGPSGGGKSSLVFAGLLPSLRKQRRTLMWDVVTLRPGKWPLHALAESFWVAPENAGPAETVARLEKEAAFYRDGDAETLAQIVERRLDAAPEKPDRLLIYVDQWEELYAMAPAPDDKERFKQHSADIEKFIALLIAAAAGSKSRANVVLTVRADFYNYLIRDPLLSALLPRQQVNITPMGRDDLRSAIETPAKKAGFSFAPPELVNRILDDVGLEEGRLPLLQFALKETWERRSSDRLTAEAYTEIGGVARAIEKTAEGAYEQLTPAQQDAARRLFLRLVTPGEGQVDTRARSAIPDDPQQREIVNLFSSPKTRLLVTALQAAGPAGRDVQATVEVAHEALIQRWPTLRDWVRANRENMRARAAILRAKAEWERNRLDEKFLLDPGVQLERGRALLENPSDVAVDDIRDYVGRSIEKDERRLDAEREAALADQKRIADAERQAKEAAEEAAAQAKARASAETQRADEQAQSSRRLKSLLSVVGLLAVGATIAAGIAYQSRNTAIRSLYFYTIARAMDDYNAGNVTHARDLIETCPPALRKWEWSYLHAITEQVPVSLAGHKAAVTSVSTGANGQYIISGSEDGTVKIWDKQSGRLVKTIELGDKAINAVAMDWNGDKFLTGGDDKILRVWDTKSLSQTRSFGPLTERVLSLSVNYEGNHIVAGLSDGTISVWNLDSGELVKNVKNHNTAVLSIVFSYDGKKILSGSVDGTIILQGTFDEGQYRQFHGHNGAVNSVVFNWNDARIVSGGADAAVRIWNASDLSEIATLSGHKGPITSVAFSFGDGSSIASGGMDGIVRLWDTATGRFKRIVGQHEGTVTSVAFLNAFLVSGGTDKNVQIWDLENGGKMQVLRGETDLPWDPEYGQEVRSVDPQNGWVDSVTFSQDGKHFASASADDVVELWNTNSMSRMNDFKAPIRRPEAVAFSPTGDRIVAGSLDSRVRVLDPDSGTVRLVLKGNKIESFAVSVAFSPDGKKIASGDSEGSIRIWDASTGAELRVILGHSGWVYSVEFSRDGERLLSAGAGGIVLWDLSSGQVKLRISDGIQGIKSAVLSPDGSKIVSSSNGAVKLWNATSGELLKVLSGHKEAVNSVAVSPDGSRVASVGDDGLLKIWDTESGTEILSLKPPGKRRTFLHVEFSRDGGRILTSGTDINLWASD